MIWNHTWHPKRRRSVCARSWFPLDGAVDNRWINRIRRGAQKILKGSSSALEKRSLREDQHRSLQWSTTKHSRDLSASSVPFAFGRGYEFSTGVLSSPLPAENWRIHNTKLGTLRAADDVDVVIREGVNHLVAVIGFAIDTDVGWVGSKFVAEKIEKLVTDADNVSAADEYILWLGGRFVVILRCKDTWRIHVDATASRSCYWAEDNGRLLLASHSTLVAREVGDLSRAQSYAVLSDPDYENPSGKWLPGCITPHDCVNLVHANCVLTYSATDLTHERVFPLDKHAPQRRLRTRLVSEHVAHELRTQTEAWLSQAEESYIALTSGQDSLVVLLSSLDVLQERHTAALTYVFTDKFDSGGMRDLLGANRLAMASGIGHKILGIKKFEYAGDFARIYKKTFSAWARFPALSKALWEEVSSEALVLFGVGGEVGTAFYTDRSDAELTGELLAQKFTKSKFRESEMLIDTMEEYIEYTQLDTVDNSLADFYDLFYWESRLSGWAATGYAEYELGPTIGLPFNTRKILWPMMCMPLEDRKRKSVYRNIISRSALN